MKLIYQSICIYFQVPPELIEGFLTGTKNPVSALMEYSAMVRLNTTFDETTVEVSKLHAKIKQLTSGKIQDLGVVFLFVCLFF